MSWDPERIVGPPEQYKEIVQFFNHNVQFLKLRVQILNALSTTVDIIKSQDADKMNLVQILSTNLQEWEALFIEISSSTKGVSVKQVN